MKDTRQFTSFGLIDVLGYCCEVFNFFHITYKPCIFHKVRSKIFNISALKVLMELYCFVLIITERSLEESWSQYEFLEIH